MTKESKDRIAEGRKKVQEQSRRTEKYHLPEREQEEKQTRDEELPGEKKEIRIEQRENVQAGHSGQKRKDELPPTTESESSSPGQPHKGKPQTEGKEQGKKSAATSTEEKKIEVELDVQKEKVEIEARRSSTETGASGNEVDVNVSMDKNELHINISMQKPRGEEENKRSTGKKKKGDPEPDEGSQ